MTAEMDRTGVLMQDVPEGYSIKEAAVDLAMFCQTGADGQRLTRGAFTHLRDQVSELADIWGAVYHLLPLAWDDHAALCELRHAVRQMIQHISKYEWRVRRDSRGQLNLKSLTEGAFGFGAGVFLLGALLHGINRRVGELSAHGEGEGIDTKATAVSAG